MSERPVLGIDLGTTYSCVARLDENERVSVLFNSEGERTTPSVVFFQSDGNVLVGKMAKKELDLNDDRVIQLIKRHMGEDGYTVPMGDRADLLPQQVSAVILRYIVEDALTELGLPEPADAILADVVITVPAYFGAGERQATRDAGKLAGLNVVNIINEPTAAAIAYGLTSGGDPSTVLVYDLGGGTFDVTVIQVSRDSIRVVATGGSASLGGADWDAQIVELLVEEFEAQFPDVGDPRADREAGTPLGVVAEELKKSLMSRRETDTVTVMAHGERAKIELSRTAVEERTEELVTRTLGFTRDVCQAAKDKGVTQIDELLLVGGMSRPPIIAQRLTQEFPELPKPRLMDPDQIVAKGAALFAAHQVAEIEGEDSPASKMLPGRIGERASTPEIINVTSRGYGIKVVEGPHDQIGHVEFLISPNDEIPAAPKDTFRTVRDGQREVQIEIFESKTTQKDRALENNDLQVAGKISGLPSGLPAGQPIEVTFDLGTDAILRVRATSHGKVLDLKAKISGSMTEEELAIPLPSIQR